MIWLEVAKQKRNLLQMIKPLTRLSPRQCKVGLHQQLIHENVYSNYY